MGSVSFTPSGESIVLRLQVGGVDPDTFRNVTVALDTGATITIIPSQVLIALGYDLLNPKGRVQLITASGTTFAKRINVRRLTAIGETIISSRIKSVPAHCPCTATHRLIPHTLIGWHRKALSFQTQSPPHPSAPPTALCYSPDDTRRRRDTSSTSSEPDTMKSDSATFLVETATGQRGSVNGISTPVPSQRSGDATTSLKDATASDSNIGAAITSTRIISTAL